MYQYTAQVHKNEVSFQKYFEDRKDIDVAAVRDFVLENREIKLQENIKRK